MLVELMLDLHSKILHKSQWLHQQQKGKNGAIKKLTVYYSLSHFQLLLFIVRPLLK